jgi:hypothetical protein
MSWLAGRSAPRARCAAPPDRESLRGELDVYVICKFCRVKLAANLRLGTLAAD